MKKKNVIMLIIILTLLLGWIWRYISLNDYYTNLSNQTRCEFKSNCKVYFEDDYIDKDLSANGYWIRVDNFEILDTSVYIQRDDLKLPDDFVEPDKIALVYVTLCNENSDSPGVMLTELLLHGLDSYSNINWELLFAANQGLNYSPGIKLSLGREYSIVLPYNLKEDLFSQNDWNSIYDYEFFLRITFFPTAKDIKVN